MSDNSAERLGKGTESIDKKRALFITAMAVAFGVGREDAERVARYLVEKRALLLTETAEAVELTARGIRPETWPGSLREKIVDVTRELLGSRTEAGYGVIIGCQILGILRDDSEEGGYFNTTSGVVGMNGGSTELFRGVIDSVGE